MFFNITHSGLCKSVSLFFSCTWGKQTLIHVGSVISTEHDTFCLPALTITCAVTAEEVNGVWEGRGGGEWVSGQRGATWSPHELLRQPADLRASWIRTQRGVAVAGFPSRHGTVIWGNTVLFPLETMGEGGTLSSRPNKGNP